MCILISHNIPYRCILIISQFFFFLDPKWYSYQNQGATKAPVLGFAFPPDSIRKPGKRRAYSRTRLDNGVQKFVSAILLIPKNGSGFNWGGYITCEVWVGSDVLWYKKKPKMMWWKKSEVWMLQRRHLIIFIFIDCHSSWSFHQSVTPRDKLGGKLSGIAVPSLTSLSTKGCSGRRILVPWAVFFREEKCWKNRLQIERQRWRN